MVKIIQIGDPILEKRSRKVKDPRSPEMQKIMKTLVEVCRKKEKTGGGLAAPQLGESVRIFIARRIDLEEEYRKKGRLLSEEFSDTLWEAFINPKFTKVGKKKSTHWEGCLSIENGKVFGPVTRPSFVKVEYVDRYGNEKSLTATGYFTHIIQHETDHLNGILFVKYIDNPENLWKSKDLDTYLKEHGEFPPVV